MTSKAWLAARSTGRVLHGLAEGGAGQHALGEAHREEDQAIEE